MSTICYGPLSSFTSQHYFMPQLFPFLFADFHKSFLEPTIPFFTFLQRSLTLIPTPRFLPIRNPAILPMQFRHGRQVISTDIIEDVVPDHPKPLSLLRLIRQGIRTNNLHPWISVVRSHKVNQVLRNLDHSNIGHFWLEQDILQDHANTQTVNHTGTSRFPDGPRVIPHFCRSIAHDEIAVPRELRVSLSKRNVPATEHGMEIGLVYRELLDLPRSLFHVRQFYFLHTHCFFTALSSIANSLCTGIFGIGSRRKIPFGPLPYLLGK